MKSKSINNFARTEILALIITLCFILSAHAQLGRQQGLIDPNIAAEKDLSGLPHMTSDLVKQIMEQRPFQNVAALQALLNKSLGKEQVAEFHRKAFIHVNLNKAKRDELLLIPGVGDRMAHEFEEYRPYHSFAQFRREIGKYVDEKEVARLEQYVFIPIHLNSASDENILSIPGLGRRMLHEFKEYRPYTSLVQFRKEIGKYVDKKEVARLERYITIE
jgi:DNA uptake protein ComE-like DNA-binding protein